MRTGTNPEKFKNTKIKYWKHRIIVPVHIPNTSEDYYLNTFEVLKASIHSIIETVDTNQTTITIIDNHCDKDVSAYLEELLSKNIISKLARYNENRGKVYPILSEARASFEDYITIADADVFFMNHWEQNVFSVFNTYNKAVMVSPLPVPQTAFYCNKNIWVEKWFSIKKGQVVDGKSFEMFEIGVNPSQGFFEGKKWSWKEKQYYVESKNVKACLGATHFVATYKRAAFDNIPRVKPDFVFKNGDETKYIEKYLEHHGGYRLSTIDTYAYHMGNSIEKWVEDYTFENKESIAFKSEKIAYYKPLRYYIISAFFKIIKKFNKN